MKLGMSIYRSRHPAHVTLCIDMTVDSFFSETLSTWSGKQFADYLRCILPPEWRLLHQEALERLEAVPRIPETPLDALPFDLPETDRNIIAYHYTALAYAIGQTEGAAFHRAICQYID